MDANGYFQNELKANLESESKREMVSAGYAAILCEIALDAIREIDELRQFKKDHTPLTTEEKRKLSYDVFGHFNPKK